MRAVDTNVLVRLITRDQSAQVRSAEAFVEKGAWVPHLVLAETTWVLKAAYGAGAEEIGTAVAMLLDHRSLALQDPEVVAAALRRFRDESDVSFSDCLILEIARKAGHTPLGTFDRDPSRLDGAERL